MRENRDAAMPVQKNIICRRDPAMSLAAACRQNARKNNAPPPTAAKAAIRFHAKTRKQARGEENIHRVRERRVFLFCSPSTTTTHHHKRKALERALLFVRVMRALMILFEKLELMRALYGLLPRASAPCCCGTHQKVPSVERDYYC